MGLDLQGGSHLLLEVDTGVVQSERVEEIVSDVRQALRGRQIGYTGLGRLRDGVTVTIRDANDVELAREVLAGLAQPVVANVFGGFNQAVDLDVKAMEGQTFHLLITEEATLARNTSTLQQSIEIIRRRIDELGTTEPTIQRQGATRILVQVPGLDDPQRLKALLGQTAKLNFHLVDQNVGAFEVVKGGACRPGRDWFIPIPNRLCPISSNAAPWSAVKIW